MSIQSEIDKLEKFLLENYSDEPGKDGRNESVVDVAIRLLSEQKFPSRKRRLHSLVGRYYKNKEEVVVG